MIGNGDSCGVWVSTAATAPTGAEMASAPMASVKVRSVASALQRLLMDEVAASASRRTQRHAAPIGMRHPRRVTTPGPGSPSAPHSLVAKQGTVKKRNVQVARLVTASCSRHPAPQPTWRLRCRPAFSADADEARVCNLSSRGTVSLTRNNLWSVTADRRLQDELHHRQPPRTPCPPRPGRRNGRVDHVRSYVGALEHWMKPLPEMMSSPLPLGFCAVT